MINRLSLTLVLPALGMLLASCTSTIPTAAQLDSYHEKAAQMAQPQIDELNARKARGAISQQDYDIEMATINAKISKQAGDLAWARHELSESQMRAQGIPTGDAPIAGSATGVVSGSLYRPYSESGASIMGNNNSSPLRAPATRSSYGRTFDTGAAYATPARERRADGFYQIEE